jgi:hypothetical protein
VGCAERESPEAIEAATVLQRCFKLTLFTMVNNRFGSGRGIRRFTRTQSRCLIPQVSLSNWCPEWARCPYGMSPGWVQSITAHARDTFHVVKSL